MIGPTLSRSAVLLQLTTDWVVYKDSFSSAHCLDVGKCGLEDSIWSEVVRTCVLGHDLAEVSHGEVFLRPALQITHESTNG